MKLKELKNKLEIFNKRFHNEGLDYLFVFSRIPFNYFSKLAGNRYFYFNGKKYRYFYHGHHRTWMTERAIEIPIITKEINKYSSKKILEVGNVLNHYLKLNHDVLDKYEKFKEVINEDVATFKFRKKYDLIISISTMEHVGWDEYPKEKGKILKSISNLKRHLNKDGKIIMTVPINYNVWLDEIIENGKFFNEIYFMKRKLFNKWIQSSWKQVKNCGFNEDARGIAIIVIRK